MAQNIYESPAFFAGYATLPRSQKGLDGMPEWPSLRALLPPIVPEAGMHVLDLGCGYGWLARWLAQQGVKSVTGVEISGKMIARAQELAREGEGDQAKKLEATIEYVQADLESVDLESLPRKGGETDKKGSLRYDLVVSQLALHYITTPSLSRLLNQVFSILAPGGKFVFSVEHPVFMAPTTTRPEWLTIASSQDQTESSLAAEKGEDQGVNNPAGKKVWPLEGYSREGQRTREWFDEIVVKQHRMLGTWVSLLVDAGFVIEVLEEWVPTKEQVENDQREAAARTANVKPGNENGNKKQEVGQNGTFWEVLERPFFLLVKVGKPSS